MRIAMICACLSVGAAGAQAEQEFAEHHAHEHGVATLEVVIEGRQLLINFDSPAVNVLGFEHPPRTAAETKRVSEAAAALARGAVIFTPSPGAQCKLNHAHVDAPKWETKQNAAADEHADYEARYRFDCAQAAALTRIGINFSGIMAVATKLRAAVVTPKAQFQRELSSQAELTLQ